MKKFKSVLALLLVVCLFATLFAACAKTDEPAKDNTPAKSEDKTPAATDTPAASDGEDDEEIATVVFYMYDMRSTGGDYGAPIQDAVNEILRDTIHAEAEIHWINSGDWANKATLALTSGERVDVINLNPMSRVNNLFPQGLLMDITDLLPEYAAETVEIVKDYIGTYTYGGKVYGLPTFRNYCKNGYILMNKEMLEEMGMLEFAENIKSWSEYEEILAAVKENYTDKGVGIYGVGLSTTSSTDYTCTGDAFDTYLPYDNLGDSLGVVFNDAEGHVSLYQACDGYKFGIATNKRWFDKGYIWPDSELTTEFVDDVQKQKVIFSNICGSEYGVQTTKSGAYGYDVIAVNTCIGMVKTAQPQFTGIAVPSTAEEPEAAVKFINQLYTNPDVLNILIWGREGEEYTIEDGQVVSTPGNHYLSVDFIVGNSTILKPLMGNGADFYDVVRNINETAAKSPFLGFAFDTGDLALVMSQITACTDQYAKNMLYGGYTEEKLADYIAKLEEAGVNDYLAAAQEQLDAWVAANK